MTTLCVNRTLVNEIAARRSGTKKRLFQEIHQIKNRELRDVYANYITYLEDNYYKDCGWFNGLFNATTC